MIENEKPNRIVRHAKPCIYDHAPQGTQCVVMKKEGKMELYIQQSADEENPNWDLVDTIEQEC